MRLQTNIVETRLPHLVYTTKDERSQQRNYTVLKAVNTATGFIYYKPTQFIIIYTHRTLVELELYIYSLIMRQHSGLRLRPTRPAYIYGQRPPVSVIYIPNLSSRWPAA